MSLENCFQLSSTISCCTRGFVAAPASVLHTHHHFSLHSKKLDLVTSKAVFNRCNLSFSSSFHHSFNSRCIKSNVLCKARDAIDQGLSRGVSVMPGLDFNSVEKNHNPLNSADLFPTGTSKHWIVLMEKPMVGDGSKAQIVDHYVSILTKVMGNEVDAQMCIYNVLWQSNFGFCCELDEECAGELAGLPGVISVKPDLDFNSIKNYYNPVKIHMSSADLFPAGTSKHWLIRMEKPMVGVVTRAQMVDHYVNILTKVMGNEVDAQMCIYHVSWQSNFGFCCELDEECAGELAGVPGVLSVKLDECFESVNKNYEGNTIQKSAGSPDTSEGTTINIKTKKLFITGLSFYTSEKTLRAAFEGFGELIQVKIIMDKISKRSKGYAFIEYTTEEAASAALNEMNGKIINGWMIVVDVAKTNPPKFSRGHQRTTS